MRRLVLLALTAACQSSPANQAAPSTASTPQLADVVSTNASNVSKLSPQIFFPLLYLRDAVEKPAPPCWDALEKKLVAGYQINLNVRPFQSYFVVEGDLPRAEITECLPKALPLVTTKQDGELAVFEMPTGSPAYAAWRGKYIVLGNKQQVTEALTTPTVQSKSKWREVIAAQSPTAATWIVFEDTVLGDIFGVPTVRYVFVIESLDKTAFAGRIVVTYRNADDATKGAERIKKAEIQPGYTFPDPIIAALKRMTVKQLGVTVEASFTLETFGGLALEELAQWAAQVTAQSQEP